MAHVARDVNVRQEVHFDLHKAVAAARLAAAALDVEGEAAGAVAARLRVRRGGEQVADVGKQARIGRGVRARRAADGALVDDDCLVEVLDALEAVVPAGADARTVEHGRELFADDLVDE